MNNVAALRLKRFRFHQDFERGLSPKTRHALGEAKFTLCGLMHYGESSSSRRFSQLPTTPKDRHGTSPSDWRTFATSQPRVQFWSFEALVAFRHSGSCCARRGACSAGRLDLETKTIAPRRAVFLYPRCAGRSTVSFGRCEE